MSKNKDKDVFNVNKTICGFKTSGKIGSGSGGNVYIVDLNNGTKGALKLLFDDDGNFNKDIIEIDILSHFCHPHVVSTYGIFTKENCKEAKTVGYLMDYYPSDSFSYIFGDKIKNWKQLLKIFYQIALGIYFLNDYGILHLDIKEENIAIDKNGNVKIIDPGLSLYNFGKTLYKGSSVGTFFYKSKELLGLQEMRSYDQSNDVWSYSMMFLDYFGLRLGNKCFSALEINSKIENYAYYLYSEKYKKDTIENNLCIDKNFFKGLDINLLKEFINFLVKTDKKTRPTFKDIISHRIFNNIERNHELENNKNFSKFIYRYNFRTDNKFSRKSNEVIVFIENFLEMTNKYFFDLDVRFIFLYLELFTRLICGSSFSTSVCNILAIYFTINVLDVKYNNYDWEKNTFIPVVDFTKIQKFLPEAVRILDGIIMENRIYNYCNSKTELTKYFKMILKDPLETGIYENSFIKNIKKISDLPSLSCMDFLIENYKKFITVEKLLNK